MRENLVLNELTRINLFDAKFQSFTHFPVNAEKHFL